MSEYMEIQIPNGLVARVAIQCEHPETKQIGTWLFSGQSHREIGAAKSPLFPDCVALFEWCRANNWKGYGDGYVYEPQANVEARETPVLCVGQVNEIIRKEMNKP